MLAGWIGRFITDGEIRDENGSAESETGPDKRCC